MKTNVLLAAALLLPISASASDADFAKLIGEGMAKTAPKASMAMRPEFAQIRVVPKGKPADPKQDGKKAAPAKPAAPPATADEKAWAKVIENVKKNGKFKAGQLIMPSSFSLEETEGDVKGDHVMWGVMFLGSINDDEQFEAEGAMLTWRSYKLQPDGSFAVEFWAVETDVYGEADDVGHGTMNLKDGKPTAPPVQDQTAGVSDAKVKTQLDTMVARWAK